MMIQGSDAWLQARAGKVTASRVVDVMARTKAGWGAGRANYAAELICERLTGSPAQTFTNAAMQHGTEMEPYARAAYAKRMGVDVYECGFVPHPEIAMAGCSPDGLIGDDGLVEIKAPNTSTHLDTLLSETVPAKYVTQIQFQLACTGREWCDFVSWDGRLPPHLQMFVKRVPRDVSMILDLETEVAAFLREIDARIEQLSERYAREAA